MAEADVSNQVRTQGLTAIEAARRLQRDGPNSLPSQSGRTIPAIVIGVLREPMLALLLGGSIVYLLIGSAGEAIILASFAGLSIAITIIQESRTEHVLQALRDLSAPHALVVRDGTSLRIAGREVVRGDLLVLDHGDRVAADAALLEADDFAMDELLLTGEAVPVTKRPLAQGEAVPAVAAPGGDGQPLVFAGTMVTRGHGLARVIATGIGSQVGLIGQSLVKLEMEAPELRRQVTRIVAYSALGGGIVSGLVILLYGITRGSWLEALLAGIAIGMSLLPEEFPVVLTVFLAMGAWRISRIGVLTRRAAAIEALGSATVLCADKTGTLTCNRMTVRKLWRPGAPPMNLEEGADSGEMEQLLRTAALASATYPTDPMEAALHAAAQGHGASTPSDWSLQRSFGLTPGLMSMANAWRHPESAELLVAAKGAPEFVAELCHLSPSDRADLGRAVDSMARQGARVLALAEARVCPDRLGAQQQDHDFTFLGLIGLADPVRPDVPAALARLRDAGVRVMMITGDHVETAQSIAHEAGFATGEVLTGPEIAALDDEALATRLATATICARTMPIEKLRIVEALKGAGEIVAMTGDGVNDAPALKAAHIGIAMGRRGTDIAREAAAIVLVNDDFGAIVSAIALGRRIYDNLRKAMGFIFAVHVPIAGLALLPLITGLPLLFGPIQIALLELIIDPVCALFFEAEPEEPGLMNRRPRRAREPLFSVPMIGRSVTQGVIAFALLAGLLMTGHLFGLPADTLRALVFFALVAAIVVLVLVNRSQSASLRAALMTDNRILRIILAGVVSGSALAMLLPRLRHLLQFGPLTVFQILMALGTGILLLTILEFMKLGPLRQRD